MNSYAKMFNNNIASQSMAYICTRVVILEYHWSQKKSLPDSFTLHLLNIFLEYEKENSIDIDDDARILFKSVSFL